MHHLNECKQQSDHLDNYKYIFGLCLLYQTGTEKFRKLTGKGTISSPDATNGLLVSFSIIFQSSCATRLTSWPALSFL